MSVDDAASAAAVRLHAGRRLRWAPRWDDDAVLCFDAASGDYWVLSAAAADLLARLACGGRCAPEQSATVASLVSAGLLEPVGGDDA